MRDWTDISFKFDQYKTLPLYAITSAAQSLLTLVLAEPEDRLQHWRVALTSAFGGDGRFLASILPDLVSIFGQDWLESQPEIAVLDAEQSLQRLRVTFLNLLRLFATSERTLVVFGDDLQWATEVDVDFISALCNKDDASGGLVVICAHRSNEVDSTHPVATHLLDRHPEATIIDLQPLTPDDVEVLLLDVTSKQVRAADSIQQLSQCLHRRSKGSPLTLREVRDTAILESTADCLH